MSDVCNGITDCWHGSDELFCEKSYDKPCPMNCRCFPEYAIHCSGSNGLDLGTLLNEIKIVTLENVEIAKKYKNLKMNYKIIYMRINNMTSLGNRWIFLLYFSNIIFLDVSRNDLYNLNPLTDFVKIDILRNLSLSDNPLETLQFDNKSRNFKKEFKRLESLNISNTRIKKLDKTLFKLCKNLKILIFMNNNLESIENNFFHNLKNIIEIHLNSTNLPKNLKPFSLSTSTPLRKFYSVEYRICCLLKNLKLTKCTPKFQNSVNICSSFIYYKFMEILIWVSFIFPILSISFRVYDFIRILNDISKRITELIYCLIEIFQIIYFIFIIIINFLYKTNFFTIEIEFYKNLSCFLLYLSSSSFIPLILIVHLIFLTNSHRQKEKKNVQKYLIFSLVLFYIFIHIFKYSLTLFKYFNKSKKRIVFTQYCLSIKKENDLFGVSITISNIFQQILVNLLIFLKYFLKQTIVPTQLEKINDFGLIIILNILFIYNFVGYELVNKK